jgi:hypothetical protein
MRDTRGGPSVSGGGGGMISVEVRFIYETKPNTCHIISQTKRGNTFFQRFWTKPDVNLVDSTVIQTVNFILGWKKFRTYNLQWFGSNVGLPNKP